ncbi:(2Fe-2S)-binding protein [Janibacter sp. G1551]|jgi:isoquinoline 1-oxidoreductase alpha subunit|uniref:(2Fe-2S)-binding protein n=1 Tax=Janibacter sp. G1551 TaxID=3420440 RepID=UPI003CFD2AAC
MSKQTFTINGEEVAVEAPGDMPLLWVIRDILGITGPKYGCGIDVCKACTSLMDGEAIRPCSVPVSKVVGRNVTTIEGLADTVAGDGLHPVQEAWIEEDVSQCGYCQQGQIMNTVALLKTNPNPSDEDIDKVLNVCRCGTYHRIRQAIKRAAKMMAEMPAEPKAGGTSLPGEAPIPVPVKTKLPVTG